MNRIAAGRDSSAWRERCASRCCSHWYRCGSLTRGRSRNYAYAPSICFQVLRPRVQTARPVAIVDIDEDSLKTIGQWPWPRTTVAELVTRITQLGAIAIGFDVIFAEPDRMSPAIAEQSFRGIDADTRAKLDSLPSNDDVFADAIKHSRVVVGQVGVQLRRRGPKPTWRSKPALPSVGPIRRLTW